MAKARQPDVVFVPQGVTPEIARQSAEAAGWKFAAEPKPGPNVVYADKRIMPRHCERTGMRRDYCCCSPCRARRRRKHSAMCRCWLCYADRQGAFIDKQGERTIPTKWALFLTLTFRPPRFNREWRDVGRKRPELVFTKRKEPYAWAQGMPDESAQPNADFVHNSFTRMIRWIEKELRERAEYFVADQYGETGGRLHQHIGMTSPALVRAAEELADMRRDDPNTLRLPEVLKPFGKMLAEKAGFNRIHPWQEDAGYYIGRYIGRDAERCHWDFRVGADSDRLLRPIGRKVIAVSAELSSKEFRNVLNRWHR